MSAIARILLARNETVSGSDIAETALVRQLRDEGVHVYVGHRAENVRGAKTVVVSSAIDRRNPEYVAALRGGITGAAPRRDAGAPLGRPSRYCRLRNARKDDDDGDGTRRPTRGRHRRGPRSRRHRPYVAKQRPRRKRAVVRYRGGRVGRLLRPARTGDGDRHEPRKRSPYERRRASRAGARVRRVSRQASRRRLRAHRHRQCTLRIADRARARGRGRNVRFGRACLAARGRHYATRASVRVSTSILATGTSDESSCAFPGR